MPGKDWRNSHNDCTEQEEGKKLKREENTVTNSEDMHWLVMLAVEFNVKSTQVIDIR